MTNQDLSTANAAEKLPTAMLSRSARGLQDCKTWDRNKDHKILPKIYFDTKV